MSDALVPSNLVATGTLGAPLWFEYHHPDPVVAVIGDVEVAVRTDRDARRTSWASVAGCPSPEYPSPPVPARTVRIPLRIDLEDARMSLVVT